jgi:hypothetical protein
MYSLVGVSALAASLMVIRSASMPVTMPTIGVIIDAVADLHTPTRKDLSPTTIDIVKADHRDIPDEGVDEDDDPIERRSPTTDGNGSATMAYLDCTGIEELCDANCYAILCENQPRIL